MKKTNEENLPEVLEEDMDVDFSEAFKEEELPKLPYKKPIEIFEMSVFKEQPELQEGVVATGFIEQLYREGLTPEQIAKRTDLSVTTIKRKLNRIVNSELGKVEVNSKNLRRIEVDDYILKQFHRLESAIEAYVNKCEERNLEPAVEVLTKFQAQITKLIDVRTKLWGLDSDKGEDTKASEGGRSLIGGRVRTSVDKETSEKVADFIVGMINKS